MKKYKFVLLKLLLMVGAVGFLTSCSSSSRNNLYAYAEDSTLTSQIGTEYAFRLYLADEGRKGSEILSKDELEYGSFQLYYKDNDGRIHDEGTEYWIVNIKGEEGSDTKIFALAFADENGERKTVPVNKMTFHGDQSITVNFGENFPFSSNYEFRISSIEDYPLPMYSPKPSKIFPFLKNYAGVYVPILGGWGEVFFVGIAVILLLYVMTLQAWNLFLKVLLATVAVFAGGVYFSWLVFLPLVVPTLISLILMFIPATAKNVRNIFVWLSVISFVYCLWHFFKLEGFWMGVWMTVYVYMISMSVALWINEIFDNVCPICGNLILDTYTNAAYIEAEEAMLSVWDKNGDSNYDESDIIEREFKPEDRKPICYWCINGKFSSNDEKRQR